MNGPDGKTTSPDRAQKIREARDFLTPETDPLHPMDKETSEINGPKGPEPTRYGDWERKGICYDF